MKKKILIAVVCLTVALFALAGCGSQDSDQAAAGSGSAYTFTDALGNEVTVENPQKVVACMGGLADIWRLAGGEESLIGVSDDTDFEVAESVAKVGKTSPALNPSLRLTLIS